MAQPCKAAMAARVGLGHILDDFEDSWRSSSLSPRFRRVPVDGWMCRPKEAKTIYRQTPRAKRGREPGPEWAGPVGPGRPAQAHLGPVRPRFSPVASRVIPYLCALVCEPLTSFLSRLRLESLLCKLHYFLVESLKTCTLTLQSSGHLESCSSRVLTCDGLHDLLLKCLMNLSRKSPLKR
jgi:hypothetical protein